MSVLVFEALSKSYGKRRVLDNISQRFDHGSYAIRGANGPGKSTLIRLLAGVESADHGEIFCAGFSLHTQALNARKNLCWVPDKAALYDFLSPTEFIGFVAQARQCDAQAGFAIAESLGLGPYLGQEIRELSIGNQRKTLLAASLMDTTAVLLLDEPSNALDNAAKHYLAEHLKQRAKCSCVLFSSHDEEFCRATGALVLSLSATALSRVK